MPILANFDETKQSQLPMVELLVNLGYEYLPIARIEQERGGKSRYVLQDTAYENLRRINRFEDNGQTHEFSPPNIMRAIQELETAAKVPGIISSSQEVYKTITTAGERTFSEKVGGTTKNISFRFVDFNNPENNHFGVGVEYTASENKEIRADIVLFVNGIPLVIIENKRSSVDLNEGVDQLIKYQEDCPGLFALAQLYVATNKIQFKYATTGSPRDYYLEWREKGRALDNQTKTLSYLSEREEEALIQPYLQKALDEGLYTQILQDHNGSKYAHAQVTNCKLSAQDKGTYHLLRPERLLDILKNFIIFENGTQKIARYPQYFAVKEIEKRIAEPVRAGEPRGGVIWHTQGSGKTMTMVLLTKALTQSQSIQNARIILINDRTDLNRDISRVFRNSGLKKSVCQAKSSRQLVEFIREKKSEVITTIVHKFDRAQRFAGDFVDPDSNIYVLVDEAHRTQGGMANEEMMRMLPNACFIGFTGTPLLKKEKTQRKFGRYIDTYTIDNALMDKVILPLTYQARGAELKMDKEKIDREVARMGLTPEDEQKLRKSAGSTLITSNPKFIAEIAYDVEQHFIENFQGTGLKAQLVAPSKFAAVKFHDYFSRYHKVKTAVIISDVEKGQQADEHYQEVKQFLRSVEKHKSLKQYESEQTSSFRNDPEGVEILIVVDKLLTGFDAPRNTVLYLARPIKNHNLLQAVARVNRLFENNEGKRAKKKTSGLVIDYSENAMHLKQALDLFSLYDEADVKHALFSTEDKIQELKTAYAELEDQLRPIENRQDDQEYVKYFEPVDRRQEFYDAVNKLSRKFNECLDLPDFGKKFGELETYRQDLKKLTRIRQTIRVQHGDSKSLADQRVFLARILDQHVDSEEIQTLTAEVDIHDPKKFDKIVEASGGNPRSRAKTIGKYLTKNITVERPKDPEKYDKMSKRVEEIIRRIQEAKQADIDSLFAEIKDIQNELASTTQTEPNGLDILKRNLDVPAQIKDELSQDVYTILREKTTVDWEVNTAKIQAIQNEIDDLLYDEYREQLAGQNIENIVDSTIKIAKANSSLWS